MRFPSLAGLWRSRGDARPVRATPGRPRLCVEPLEERAVPANFTAANVAELIAAIDAANLTPEATDKITLVAGATYTLTASNNSEHGPTGLPVIDDNEKLTIIGNGVIIERSVLEGTAAFRIGAVDAGGSLTLKNLTLQGGLAKGNLVTTGTTDWSRGGAIFNQGTLNLEGVTFQNNTAQGLGSWWYFSSFPAGNGEGGAVYSNGVVSVVNSVITNNFAIGGRGLNALAAGPVVTQGGPPGPPSFGAPGADGIGGGIYVAGGTVAITDSTFSGNTAKGGDGGNGFGKKLGNTTAAGDGGDGFGGGLYALDGAVTLHHVSMTDNHALGGLGGAGNPVKMMGKDGKGIGGGIYILVDADVGLDAFSVNHIKQNDASTSHKNIRGAYDVIS